MISSVIRYSSTMIDPWPGLARMTSEMRELHRSYFNEIQILNLTFPLKRVAC